MGTNNNRFNIIDETVIDEPVEEQNEVAKIDEDPRDRKEEEEAEDESNAEDNAEEVEEGQEEPEEGDDAEADQYTRVELDGEPGDEEEAKYQGAAPWVKDLRKAQRETAKENRALKKRLQELENPAPSNGLKPLGKKPELEDFDYETGAYEKALGDWFDLRRSHDEANRRIEDEKKAADDAWQAELNRYEGAKKALKVRDYEEAESHVLETMSQTQQGIIVSATENPAVMVYALGTNPAKLKELAAIKDPVKFTAAIARLEATKLKVTTRAAPPPPEKIPKKGASGGGNSMENRLDQLRRDAEKTGDYTKVNEYKRQQKQTR